MSLGAWFSSRRRSASFEHFSRQIQLRFVVAHSTIHCQLERCCSKPGALRYFANLDLCDRCRCLAFGPALRWSTVVRLNQYSYLNYDLHQCYRVSLEVFIFASHMRSKTPHASTLVKQNLFCLDYRHFEYLGASMVATLNCVRQSRNLGGLRVPHGCFCTTGSGRTAS